MGVGCCRTKLSGGDFCLPINNGTDCQSGICNNYIQPFEFGGITWNLGFWNLFGGYCGTMAKDINKTSSTTITTTTTTSTTTDINTATTATNFCPIPMPDPCTNQIPECVQMELLQMTSPAQVEEFCNDGLTQCCPKACKFMGC